MTDAARLLPDPWQANATDRDLLVEMSDILPDRVLDAHAHLYRVADLGLTADHWLRQGPEAAGVAAWREGVGALVGRERLAGGLFIAFPAASGDMDAANAWVIQEAESFPSGAASIVVSPASDPAAIERLIEEHPVVKGLKPYHVFSPRQPTFQARLADYMPAWAWDLAARRGLAVTLHLVRDSALADPENLREVREAAGRHPGAAIILAHAGRGFHAPNTVAGVAALTDLDNLYFDASAICEAAPLLAILDGFGPRRLMYGSDFPVNHLRQRAVTVGKDFAWVSPARADACSSAPVCRPALVGVESLRALREAARLFGLNRADLEDVFHDNAARLLGLRRESGTQTQDLYRHARTRIPGGTQLLSKRPEMFAPGAWPAYFREARGCEVWDLDGRRYTDMTLSGIGACALGFRDPDVTAAVLRRVRLGSMCTLNPPEEVELADRLCALHPWAARVRFARGGGEIAAAAVRIARAATGRTAVAICGYHGWHDWYLAANLGESDALRGHLLPGLEPAGVPSELRGTAFPFTFNNRSQFQAILDEHGSRLAAVVMEPCRYQDPDPGFLEFVRDGAHRVGALLIFDEITIGWRLILGGAHLRLGVAPDLAIFAKALGNGHPVAALLGTRAAMAGAESSFISSTYWTESVGPAAALAVLDKMERVAFPDHARRIGGLVQAAWREEAAAAGAPVEVAEGYPALAHFKFNHPEADALRALFTTLMLKRGFLASTACYPSLAHTEAVVDRFRSALGPVFRDIAEAVARKDIRSRLAGEPAHSGFRRLL
jgi:glutamate-1-semialdehyde 2,1-aminomutase